MSSSSDDDSDSSYDAPDLRLFGVRGSRKNAAPQPEPEPEPEPVETAPAGPQTGSPAATASPVHSVPRPVRASSSSSSPAASRELLELTQKVQALEAMKLILSRAACAPARRRCLMHNDISRPYFHARALRDVFVEIVDEDRNDGDDERCGWLNLSLCGTQNAPSN